MYIYREISIQIPYKCTELELKSLEYRRFITDVTFLCKILNYYLNLDISGYVNFYSLDDQYALRGFECLKLTKTMLGPLILNFHLLIEL